MNFNHISRKPGQYAKGEIHSYFKICANIPTDASLFPAVLHRTFREHLPGQLLPPVS